MLTKFYILPALIHIAIFAMESLFFKHPNIYRLFAVRTAELATVRSWAFNQGFYNLFLAIGIFAGHFLLANSETQAMGKALITFNLLSIVGAGVVLLLSEPRKLWRGALLQIVPALTALIFFLNT